MIFRLFVVLFLSANAVLAVGIKGDSIQLTEKNGRQVILYEVGPKETVYSIARKYDISPKAIIALNPDIESGLKTGQKIYVPYALKARTKELKPEQLKGNNEDRESKIYHTIEPGQTLYSISKRYNVTVDELKSWNGISENEVKSGMTIIVGTSAASASASTVKGAANVKKTSPSREVTRSNTGYEKIVERGNVETFDTPEGNSFHFALHKSAPNGTVIKVVNDATGSSVFVRVIGKLNDPSGETVLKVSKIAMERLAGTGRSFKGEVSYIP